MCRHSPERTCSASTRTPTSIDVRHAALTVARTVTSIPTKIGCSKVMRSIPAVTMRVPQWRIAAIPATSSHMRMISPPCTLPAEFDSVMPIQRTIVELDLDGGRGSIAVGSLGRRFLVQHSH